MNILKPALVLLLLAGPACRENRHRADLPPCPPCGSPTPVVPLTRLPSEATETTRGQGVPPEPVTDPDLVDNRRPDDPADALRLPFTLSALYEVRTVGSPVLSPDGTRVLFTLSTPDLKAGKNVTDIWMATVDGTRLVQLTRHDGADFSPVWAPDGESFFFLSSRKDGIQLWRMPLAGGDPEKLTSMPVNVERPVVSPTGRHLVFVAEMLADAGGDPEKHRELAARRKQQPRRARVAEHLFYRYWDKFREGHRRQVFLLDPDTREVTCLTPTNHDSPAFGWGAAGLSFSPDGQEIAFESNRDPDEDAKAERNNTDIFVLPVTGGMPRNLTPGNAGFDGSPEYSPDGRYIAFRSQATPGFEADLFTLKLYDRTTGETVRLAPEFDNWIQDFRWMKDRIVFTAPVKGRYPLYLLNPADGAVEPLGNIGHQRQFDVAADGTLAFTHSTTGRPTELYAQVPGGPLRKLTAFNQAVIEKYDLRPAREFWIPGADGKPVHTFVVLPHGYRPGQKYPLVLNVHGGPQMQWSDTFRGDWQVYPGAGAVVAFPNPHGSTGYGQAYTAAISRDWGGKVYRDVMAIAEYLTELDFVDASRMAVMGWSYGGYLVNWIAVHPHPFVALASMMGVWDLRSFYGATEELWFPEWDLGGTPWENPEAYEKFSPSARAQHLSVPMLVVTGEKDYRVPYTQSLQLFTALRKKRIPSRLVVLPDDGHWPHITRTMPVYYAVHLEWFAQYLKTSPPDVPSSTLLGH